MPNKAKNAYDGYESNGWKGNVTGQSKGTKAGKAYRNSNDLLPSTDVVGNPITYKEFDVNNRNVGKGRDTERFVVGSDGSVYYTDSHYGDVPSPTGFPDFVKIK